MTIRKLIAMAAAGAALAWGGAAAANSYNFTYSAASPTAASASGVLTTVAGAGDSQLITGISGTFDGSAITALLAPSACCSSPPNDNLLFPNGDSATGADLDEDGFAFTTAAGSFNIFYDNSAPNGYSVAIPGNPYDSALGTFTLTPGVPEPMTWALMLLGVGALGVAMRRRTAAAALA